MKKSFWLCLIVPWCSAAAYAQIGNIVVPNGHSSTVDKVLLDKQHKYLYTVEQSKVIMWDAKTHLQLYTFTTSGDKLADADISNDGTMLAVSHMPIIECFSTVTGKKLFAVSKGYYGKSVKFSTDDKKLFTCYEGLVAIDIATQEESKEIAEKSFGFESHLEVIDASHIVAYKDGSWELWNINKKALEFKYSTAGQAFRSNYMRNLNCFATWVGDKVEFRVINNGKLLGKLPAQRIEYVLIPSEDNKNFFMNDGKFDGNLYTVYNGATFLPVNKLTLRDYVTNGHYLGASHTMYASTFNDVYMLSTKTGKKGDLFRRQVADFGIALFSSMEYNHGTGLLNIMTDDNVYKSIDLVKLKPFRHKVMPFKSANVAFSPTGDTVAVFDNKTAYIKNIATGTVVMTPFKLADEVASHAGDQMFFDNDASHVYYSTFNIKRQLTTLHRLDIKTGVTQDVLSYPITGPGSLHPDKSLVAYTEFKYQHNAAKVYDLKTGKELFEQDYGDKHADYIHISQDKKKVLLIRDRSIEVYDLETGKILSKTTEYFTADDFVSYACSPDLSTVFVFQQDGRLAALNASTAKPIYTKPAHSGSIRAALFSPNGKIMYTVSTDETIKVWEPVSGRLLGTTYLFNDGNDFVFIDQYGRFDGTEGGIKRMYYYRNRIKVSLDVVYEKFYTPNLYQRLVNGEIFDPIDIIINPQPKARISYAEVARNLNVVEDKVQAYNNATGAAEITVNASAENDKVDEIRLFHNGKIVNLATRGLFVSDNTTGTDIKKYTVNLLPGVNNIRAVALNSQRTESEPDEITVTYKVAGQPNAPVPGNNGNKGVIALVDKNATMHLVVVGINAYKNPKMSLNYALADATAFKEEAEKDAHTLITNVKTYFVTDDKADKSGIIAAFTEVQKNAKPQDLFVFYYAGHGVISDKNKEFYLVPTDVTDLKNVDEALAQNGIPSKMLQQYAIDISAQKQLFILDACQSAGAFQQLMSNDANQQKSLAVVARSTGTHWIAASGSQQFAQEFAQLGHGAFTYVLLKAMKGAAAYNKMITVNGLKSFLQVQLPSLMKKYNGAPQYPATYGYGSDFPVQVMQ
nr:caspase family protein [uncultured Mucilaginibacter sp.]